ncbi:hypothetical protein WAI453_012425 [Rhynchosporium graminicola]|uniref:Transcription factor CBF/NF-Y/archaeal histone domain-containing protein n=1 Tax=Rhynchosporium graminicola TaxID=2792576 RepID=A0A1E1KYE9_9HELO|nr:uncharacterized protein RCO7_06226 [Rhynchosporium commune]
MDNTYAPQSPDLSSFLSSPPKTKKTHQPSNNPQSTTTTTTASTTNTNTTSYAPRSPNIPSFVTHSSHQLNSFGTNQTQFGLAPDGANDIAEYGSNSCMPPIPPLPPSHSDQFNAQIPFQGQFQNQTAILDPHSSGVYGRPHRQARNNIPSYSDDFEPPEQAYEQDQGPYITSPHFPPPPQAQQQFQQSYPQIPQDQYILPQQPHSQPQQQQEPMSSRGPRIKPDPSSTNNVSSLPTYTDPNPLNIEIRTKFPVARIKRIMQADEEVGKVAQVTPVAVSKALELFMIALVGGAAEKAKEKGGKKVSAAHLKQVVLGSEQFDFLAEIVGRVAEVQEGAGGEGKRKGGKGKEENGGSDSSEEEKKPKKARGRKKKNDD